MKLLSFKKFFFLLPLLAAIVCSTYIVLLMGIKNVENPVSMFKLMAAGCTFMVITLTTSFILSLRLADYFKLEEKLEQIEPLTGPKSLVTWNSLTKEQQLYAVDLFGTNSIRLRELKKGYYPLYDGIQYVLFYQSTKERKTHELANRELSVMLLDMILKETKI